MVNCSSGGPQKLTKSLERVNIALHALALDARRQKELCSKAGADQPDPSSDTLLAASATERARLRLVHSGNRRLDDSSP